MYKITTHITKLSEHCKDILYNRYKHTGQFGLKPSQKGKLASLDFNEVKDDGRG